MVKFRNSLVLFGVLISQSVFASDFGDTLSSNEQPMSQHGCTIFINEVSGARVNWANPSQELAEAISILSAKGYQVVEGVDAAENVLVYFAEMDGPIFKSDSLGVAAGVTYVSLTEIFSKKGSQPYYWQDKRTYYYAFDDARQILSGIFKGDLERIPSCRNLSPIKNPIMYLF